MKVNGVSGCYIYIDKYKVFKRAVNGKYHPARLKAQAKKQQQCYELLTGNPYLAVPLVYKTINEEDGLTIVMERVHGLDFIELINEVPLYKVIDIFKYLLDFISNNIYYYFDDICIEYYLDTIFKKLSHDRNLGKKPSTKIYVPSGFCHGDLTFSNIIFGKKTYLLDFLDIDNNISSPVFDLVKLRQDTRYKWITQIYQVPFDKIKVNIVLDKLDKLLLDRFGEQPVLEWFSLARILPYLNNGHLIDYVLKQMEGIKLKCD